MYWQEELSWDWAKEHKGKHGQRILQTEHRGRQPSFGARVGEIAESVWGEREPTHA